MGGEHLPQRSPRQREAAQEAARGASPGECPSRTARILLAHTGDYGIEQLIEWKLLPERDAQVRHTPDPHVRDTGGASRQPVLQSAPPLSSTRRLEPGNLPRSRRFRTESTGPAASIPWPKRVFTKAREGEPPCHAPPAPPRIDRDCRAIERHAPATPVARSGEMPVAAHRDDTPPASVCCPDQSRTVRWSPANRKTGPFQPQLRRNAASDRLVPSLKPSATWAGTFPLP